MTDAEPPGDETATFVTVRRAVITLGIAWLVTMAVVFGGLFGFKALLSLWH